jgi:hypothetical protein
MRVNCFECALRACGLFKPVSQSELAFINDMKRDLLTLPAGTAIVRDKIGCRPQNWFRRAPWRRGTMRRYIRLIGPDITLFTTGSRNQLHGKGVGVADAPADAQWSGLRPTSIGAASRPIRGDRSDPRKLTA